MKKKISTIFAFLPFAAIIILCVISLFCGWNTEQKEKEEIKHISAITASTQVQPNATESTDKNKVSSANISNTTYEKHSISELIKMNKECIGWISIPNAPLSYPVMHTPNNSQKYLNKDFYGNYSQSGTPFLDGRCSTDSTNLIIYGHHMNNGSVFGELCNYTNKDYFKKHPRIVLQTKEGVSSYKVISVMKATVSDPWYSFIQANTELKYLDKTGYAKCMSLHKTDIIPEFDNQLLTLSTCYGNSKDGRLLVVAVKEV